MFWTLGLVVIEYAYFYAANLLGLGPTVGGALAIVCSQFRLDRLCVYLRSPFHLGIGPAGDGVLVIFI